MGNQHQMGKILFLFFHFYISVLPFKYLPVRTDSDNAVPVVPPPCPGCYKPSEVNQEIVDFALSELQGGDRGKCASGVSRVENFQSQVRQHCKQPGPLSLVQDNRGSVL